MVKNYKISWANTQKSIVLPRNILGNERKKWTPQFFFQILENFFSIQKRGPYQVTPCRIKHFDTKKAQTLKEEKAEGWKIDPTGTTLLQPVFIN